MASGVAGYAKWAAAMITSIPIWVGGAGLLLFQFVTNPAAFVRRKDRSAIEFPDPFPGLEHEMAEVNGIRLHVVVGGRTKGAARKPLMLFVHGFPEMWYSWRHQMQAFMAEYEVAAFDMRGYGSSEVPQARSEFSQEKLAADVVAVIRHLGAEQCVLVGHDWGGAIVWKVASWYPEVVQKLVVMAGPHPKLFLRNMDAAQKKKCAPGPPASQYIWFFQAPYLPELLWSANDYAMLEQAFTSESFGSKTPGAVSAEDLERYKQAFARPGSMTAALNYYRAMVDGLTWRRDPRRKEHKIEMPVLVLWGDSDEALGTGLLRGIEEVVSHPEVHVLKDCSHWIPQDRPEEVNRLMRQFLKPKAAL